MEEELCPLDDRRSAAEVALKLAVVHFTTMTAYCHLLSMRGEPTRLICKKMFLFVMYPGYIIIQHITAILAIVSALVLARLKKPRDSTRLQSSLKRAPFILFGAAEQHPPQSDPHSSNEESKVKLICRLIVVLALSAQCIGSCIVFARRYQHDATTISDWRVLDLATAALLINLFTVVHLLWHPVLKLGPNGTLGKPQEDHLTLTYLDATLLYIRRELDFMTSYSVKDKREKWQRLYLGIFVNAPTTIGACWVQSWESGQPIPFLLGLFPTGGLVAKLGVFDYKRPICEECASNSWWEVFAITHQIIFLIITTTISVFLVALSAKVFSRRWTAVSQWRILLRLLVLVPLGILTWGLTWGLTVVFYFLALLSILYPLFNVLSLFAQIAYLRIQLLALADWPTDSACPLLWSDPSANVLWHLM